MSGQTRRRSGAEHRKGTPHARRARYVTAVVRRARPGPAALADLLAGFRARGQGAWPSQAWMAARLNVTVRTIRRWTNELEAAGVVDVTRRRPHHHHLTGQFRRRTNRYRCRFANEKRGPMTGKDQVTPSGHSCPQYDPPGGVHDGADPPDLRSERDDGPVPAFPTRPPWVQVGMTASEWANRRMGRP